MSSWKPQSHADIGQKDPSVALPVPPTAAAAPAVAGASSASPGASSQPSAQTQAQTPSGGAGGPSVSSIQAFSHQQAPVLPPPSAIGNGKLPSVSDAAAAAAVDDQKGNPNYKPLNVKDALYYLDQVKLQFRNQTDVYNNFLDIMKDFKSQK
ncbi:hypothetical protein PMKS-001859 [Pichia membranifaciens]|uniref:Uncharacterized protein n=1 Tax=Pichia membranifaciens TaxID=4926 RepID=A0A1Q2YFU7_9ASCO|nr:hypothetical protein PMKS-001859 [Pichia membranifaciens]